MINTQRQFMGIFFSQVKSPEKAEDYVKPFFHVFKLNQERNQKMPQYSCIYCVQQIGL